MHSRPRRPDLWTDAQCTALRFLAFLTHPFMQLNCWAAGLRNEIWNAAYCDCEECRWARVRYSVMARYVRARCPHCGDTRLVGPRLLTIPGSCQKRAFCEQEMLDAVGGPRPEGGLPTTEEILLYEKVYDHTRSDKISLGLPLSDAEWLLLEEINPDAVRQLRGHNARNPCLQ